MNTSVRWLLRRSVSAFFVLSRPRRSKSVSFSTEMIAKYIANKRNYKRLDTDMFKDVIKNNGDAENVERVLFEWEMIKYSDQMIPSTITPQQMKELMEINDRPQLLEKFIEFLKSEITSNYSLNRKKKTDYFFSTKDVIVSGVAFDKNTGEPKYSFAEISLFQNISTRRETQLSSIPKLFEITSESSHVQKLIIDFDFHHDDSYLSRTIIRSIYNGFWYNARYPEPFDFHVYGLKPGSIHIENFATNLSFDLPYITHPLSKNLHSESVEEKLTNSRDVVYITSNNGTHLKEFDPDVTYVINAFYQHELDSKKASEKCHIYGWRCVRFPHLRWLRLPPKELSLIDVIKILSEMKHGASIEDAMSKFLFQKDDLKGQRMKKMNKIFDDVSELYKKTSIWM